MSYTPKNNFNLQLIKTGDDVPVYTPENNSNLQLGRTGIGEIGFRKKLLADVACCDESAYYFDYGFNPDFLLPSGSVTIEVRGGCPNFSWSTDDAEYTFTNPTTSGRTNTLNASAGAETKAVLITIQDSCGNRVYAYVANCFSPLPDLPLSSLRFVVHDVNLTAHGMLATEGGSVTFHWGVGDAQTDYSGPSQSWSHVYDSIGSYTINVLRPHNLRKLDFSAAEVDGVTLALENLPNELLWFYCASQDNVGGVTGTLADLPSDLEFFTCYCRNTISGDLADLPPNLAYFHCKGLNTISNYTGKTWTTPLRLSFYPVSGGLSTAEIDQLLIDLEADVPWTGGFDIVLKGTNAAPSGASAAAIASIEAQGSWVTTN